MLAWRDLSVIQLGRAQYRIAPGNYSTANWKTLFSKHPTPRLISPPIKANFDNPQPRFMTIVSWGAVADFEDESSSTPIPTCILTIKNNEWVKPLPTLDVK